MGEQVTIFFGKPWAICERDCGLFRLSSKLILWMWTSSRQQCIICFRCLYSLGFEDNYKHKLGPPTLPDTHIAGERCQVQLHLFSPGRSPGTGQGSWSSWQYSLEIFGVKTRLSITDTSYQWIQEPLSSGTPLLHLYLSRYCEVVGSFNERNV